MDQLRAQRETLMQRISWWEEHRHGALVPLVLACFGAGWGVGWLGHLALGLPAASGYLAAVFFVFVVGRWIDRAMAPSRLDALDARIARAERALRAAAGRSPTGAAPR